MHNKKNVSTYVSGTCTDLCNSVYGMVVQGYVDGGRYLLGRKW